MRLFILLLIVAPAYAGVERSALQDACVKNVSRLVSQYDSIYDEHRAERLGLCGPACIVIAAAGAEYLETGEFPSKERFAQLMNRLAKDAYPAIGYGTRLDQRKKLILDFFKKQGFEVSTEDREFPKSEADLEALADATKHGLFGLIGIEAAVGPLTRIENSGLARLVGDQYGGHVLLVTGIDKSKKELKFIDPNHPEREGTARYHVAENGRVALELDSRELDYVRKQPPTGKIPDGSRLIVNSTMPVQLNRPVRTPPKGSRITISLPDFGRRAMKFVADQAAAGKLK